VLSGVLPREDDLRQGGPAEVDSDIMVDAALLPHVSILGGLAAEEQERIWALLEERTYEPGAVVVEEGTPGRELFIVAQGTAEVTKRAPDGSSVRLAQLVRGACFGEMALVGITRRTATVHALSPLRVLVLPWARIAELSRTRLETFAMLVMNLARDLCRRLQAADALLAEFGVSASRREPFAPTGGRGP
jgi:CRP/FNR family transcriptional regulator, cyclic AMP receptor protein